MISARFLIVKESDEILSVSVSGHAEFSADGEYDVICASVSALVFATVNALEDYVGLDSGLIVDESGATSFNIVPIDERTAIQAQTLANCLYMALTNLSEENEEYLQVSVKEE